jgi:hypothetical protein
MLMRFNQYLTVLKTIKKTSSEKTIKFYKQKLEDFFKKALVEYQFYILTEADKLAKKNDLTCYHKFECLVKKQYLQKTIQSQIQNCQKLQIQLNKNFDIKNNNLSNISKIMEDQVKCLLLAY